MLTDAFDREINYIRISVTDRCNLRCQYCIPKEGIRLCSHEELLRFDEIERLTGIFAGLGIRAVKLTGGEPFIRRDFMTLAKRLKEIEGIKRLTVTTNGTCLTKENIPELLDCFDGINISLDTMNPQVYYALTGTDIFEETYKGIEALLQQNRMVSRPAVIKLNSVLTEKNRADIIKIIQLAKEQELSIRFIELMPIGLGKSFLEKEKAVYKEDDVKELIEKQFGPLKLYEKEYGNGPAVYYTLEGFQGKIGFISAITHKFCSSCNRIRLTANGYLKLCLQYDAGLDLKALIRGGAEDVQISNEIEKAVRRKPIGHAFLEEGIDKEEQHCMSEIGG